MYVEPHDSFAKTSVPNTMSQLILQSNVNDILLVYIFTLVLLFESAKMSGTYTKCKLFMEHIFL